MKIELEIEDDERGGKLKIKKTVVSADDIDNLELEIGGVQIFKGKKKLDKKTPGIKLKDPDGNDQELIFAVASGSRWVYINGRWYYI